MAIGVTGIPDVSFAEANPFLTGYQASQDLQKQMLANQLAQMQNKYYPQMAQQDLVKAIQYNQNYVPDIQSQIDLRNKQGQQAGAQAQYYGQEADVVKPKAYSEIAYQSAQATREKALADIATRKQRMVENILNGNYGQQQGGGQQQPAPPQSQSGYGQQTPYQAPQVQQTGYGASPTPSRQVPIQQMPGYGQPQPDNGNSPNFSIPGNSQQSPSQQNIIPNVNYLRAQVATNAMGLPESAIKISDINGTHTAMTPFGNYPLAQGPTGLQKELYKVDAKHVGNLEDDYGNALKFQDPLGHLANIVTSPTWESMRNHPLLGKYELSAYKYNGTTEQKQTVGQFISNAGEIYADFAKEFKGSFRVGEQQLVNNIKVNENDTVDSARGKIQAMMALKQIVQQRSKMANDLMRNNGYSYIDALDTANKNINADRIEDDARIKVGMKPLHPENYQNNNPNVYPYNVQNNKVNPNQQQLPNVNNDAYNKIGSIAAQSTPDNPKIVPVARNLSKNMQIPTFKDKEDFQNWYNRQDPNTQQAWRLNKGANW